MTDQTTQMAKLLLTENFERKGPSATTLTDPIVDTPMVVTLDQLHPYELNPRLTRNPLYDEIKASIRERGLDAPPAITRRPGEPVYIIRNGGNTRLSILRELWAELKEERFFRIPCLFRPWSERGEIIALTGHLAENELHGSLTFIERALGVEKVRELYEKEHNSSLSQSELARRLAADGYPVSQPHISRMQDTVRHLLPSIPSLLYAGLGRPQVEKLINLRKAGLRLWEWHSLEKIVTADFAGLFHEVISLFDSDSAEFSVQRVQDELIGQMSVLLDIDYDTLLLEINGHETWQQRTSPPQQADQSDQPPSVKEASPTPTLPSPPVSTETSGQPSPKPSVPRSSHPELPHADVLPAATVPLQEPLNPRADTHPQEQE